MGNYYSLTSHKYSRLNRRYQQKKNLQTMIFSLGTILVIALLLIFGVPALINMSLLFARFKKDAPQPKSLTFLSKPVIEPTYEATNSAEIVIRGVADSNTTLTLYLNNQQKEENKIDQTGSFIFPSIFLKEGENKIYVKATIDKESLESEPITVAYDKKPPKREITEPQDNQNYRGDQRYALVSGKTEETDSVLINDRLTILNADGSFAYRLLLNEGENKITIIAMDKAGNKVIVEKKVNYSK